MLPKRHINVATQHLSTDRSRSTRLAGLETRNE
jgi:hypothetical protein